MNKLSLLPLIGLLSVSACTGSLKPSMFESTTVTPRNIELHEERFMEKKKVNEINHMYLADLSGDYKRYADSPLYVVFAYDPDIANVEKASINNRAAITKGQLAKMGVNSVVKTLPVDGAQGDVVVAYDKITATGPQNCGEVPGMNGVQTGAYGDYGIGCTVKDMMAKQIARPRDLKGNDDLGDMYEGGRAANIVNRDVRAGETNEFVPSYILSELAGNTSE